MGLILWAECALQQPVFDLLPSLLVCTHSPAADCYCSLGVGPVLIGDYPRVLGGWELASSQNDHEMRR